MASPFARLGLEASASEAEIRKKYFELAKLYHPDKSAEVDEFRQIQEAYEILTDPEKRQRYERELEREKEHSKANPAATEVDLDDMDFDEVSKSFSTDCRCGGKFVITETDLENGFDAVECPNCSLEIVILYQKN